MNLLQIFEKLNKSSIVAISILLISVLGVIDTVTGNELAFSLFYLIPIILITWRTGQKLGMLFAVISAIVWLISDIITRSSYLHPAIYAWNALIRLSFFIIIVYLLSKLMIVIKHEREMARTDYLTGALNLRFFCDVLQMEINRSQRYKNPFTIVYIDLDNFKTVNDNFGHATGDRVLSFVVEKIKNNLRKTDIISRIGGDEFVLLMPETKQDAAQAVLSKLQQDILAEMNKNDWPVTLSIGVLTCIDAPQTADKALREVDGLMYSVKRSSKNGIKYAIYTS